MSRIYEPARWQNKAEITGMEKKHNRKKQGTFCEFYHYWKLLVNLKKLLVKLKLG